MSGIAGFIKKDIVTDQATFLIDGMLGALRHRGSDAQGVWMEHKYGAVLGNARISSSGRTIISYEGEVYNHKQIALELAKDGIFVKGQSDAEVVLEAVERWGLERALKKFNGVFSFALWDAPRGTLILVRDRVGVKPLYYGWIGKTFVFSSEIRAIEKFATGRLTVDVGILDQYLKFGYIPAPLTIYRELSKLPAGSYLQIENNQKAQDPTRYWAIADAARRGTSDQLMLNEGEIVEELEALLTDSVRQQMSHGDTPGAFLSGGVESALIAALMQRLSKEAIRTFSLGFSQEGYNDSSSAQFVSQHIGTKHTALIARDQDILRTVLKLPFVYGEPFANASQIPLCLVAEMAKKSVGTALTGYGADEFFGGHARYQYVNKLSALVQGVPLSLRGLAVRILKLCGANMSRFLGISQPIESHKLSQIFRSTTALEIYDISMAHWENPDEVLERKLGIGAGRVSIIRDGGLQDQFMCIDQQTSLTDDTLLNIDRACMAVSLEPRQPFLDHRVMEYAWRIPLRYKTDNSNTKSILKKILARHMPQALNESPQMGFRTPVGIWIKGLLREWAEDLLEPKKMSQEGVFNVQMVQERWKQHQNGIHDWQYPLWDILMFQAWKRSK